MYVIYTEMNSKLFWCVVLTIENISEIKFQPIEDFLCHGEKFTGFVMLNFSLQTVGRGGDHVHRKSPDISV